MTMRFFSIPLTLLLAGLLVLTTSCDQEPITLSVPVSFDSLQFKIRPAQVGIASPGYFATAFRDVDSSQVYEALQKINLNAFLKHIKEVNLQKLAFTIPAGATGDISAFDTLSLMCKKPGAALPQTVAKIPVSTTEGTTSLTPNLAEVETDAAAVEALAYPHGLGVSGSTANDEALDTETTLSTSLDVDVIIELDPNN